MPKKYNPPYKILKISGPEIDIVFFCLFSGWPPSPVTFQIEQFSQHISAVILGQSGWIWRVVVSPPAFHPEKKNIQISAREKKKIIMTHIPQQPTLIILILHFF